MRERRSFDLTIFFSPRARKKDAAVVRGWIVDNKSRWDTTQAAATKEEIVAVNLTNAGVRDEETERKRGRKKKRGDYRATNLINSTVRRKSSFVSSSSASSHGTFSFMCASAKSQLLWIFAISNSRFSLS